MESNCLMTRCHLYEPAFVCAHLHIARNCDERMRDQSCPKKTGSIAAATVLRGEARRCVAMSLEALDLFLDRWQDQRCAGSGRRIRLSGRRTVRLQIKVRPRHSRRDQPMKRKSKLTIAMAVFAV